MKEFEKIAIPGIRIGHAQNSEAATGCTVILCEKGAVAGVDVRGGAPGTLQTDLLNPMNLVEVIHGVLLTGGSAFGLEAAFGVMAFLEERGCGFDVGATRVPIVCGAVLFDLTFGDHRIRPDRAMGYLASTEAQQGPLVQGNVGAGCGATVGKILGMESCMKGGWGVAGLEVGDLNIQALVAVNCLGDVVDPATGNILAGALKEDRKSFAGTEAILAERYADRRNLFHGNTTIGAIVTNARLTRPEANKIASMAHNGLARAIRPSHTLYDGDTIFALATGQVEADITVLGSLGANIMAKAVANAVKSAQSLHGVPCRADLHA